MKRWMSLAGVVLISVSVYAADGIWTNQTGGVWTNADNWSEGVLADGAGAVADFTELTLSRSMEVCDPVSRTLGRLVFDDLGGSYPWSVNNLDVNGEPTDAALTLSLPSSQPEILVSNTIVYISKRLEGTEGLLKTGTGALYVMTNAAYSGLTEVREGLLSFGVPDAGSFPEIVARYTFENAANIGKDLSGNGNDLDITGTVVYDAAGYHGGGALFDGNSYLYCEDLQGFPSGNESFSMALWVRPTSTAKKSIMGWGDFNTRHGCTGLQIESPGTSVTHYIYDGGYNLNATVSGLQNGWTHLAVTYDSETKERNIYVDGMLDGSKDLPVLNIPAQNLMLGCALNDLRFAGWMDEVTVTKGALTVEQIGLLMAGSTPFAEGTASLPFGGDVAIGPYGTLSLGQNTSTGSLSGDGVLQFRDETNGLLTVSGMTNFSGRVEGGVDLCVTADTEKGGVLSGVNGYTGSTDIDGGNITLSGNDDLSSHIVAFYAFNDEATLCKDSSANGNDMSIRYTTGRPFWSADGKIGGALCMTNDNWLRRASTGFSGLKTGLVPFTVAAWVNYADDAPINSTLFAWRMKDGKECALRLSGTSEKLSTGYSNDFDMGVDLKAGEHPDGWHHLALLFTPDAAAFGSAQFLIYVDGVRVSERTISVSVTNNQDFVIGTFYGGASEYCFRGLIDEFAVLDRADPADVRRLMQGAMQPQPKRMQGVVAHYRFEDPDNLGCDCSGYGNTFHEYKSENGKLSWMADGMNGGALSITNWNLLRYANGDNPLLFGLPLVPDEQPFTIAFWCNPATNCPAQGTFFWIGNPYPGQNCFQMRFQSAFNKIGIGPRDINGVNFSNKIVTVDADLSEGESPEGWHHMAVTYDPDGGSHRYVFYLDGRLTAMWRGCAMSTAMDSYFYIGSGEILAETKTFKGLMDDFVVLNRAVPPGEIPFLMNAEGMNDGCGVLPKETDVSVASEAELTVRNLDQTVASLSGTGDVTLNQGILRVCGATGVLSGVLSGTGSVVVADGTVQTLAGSDAVFVGELRVTNSMLSVTGPTGAGTTVQVQSGGLFGGSGALAGPVTVESGGALIAREGSAFNFDGGLDLQEGSGFKVAATNSITGNISVSGNLAVPAGGFVVAELPDSFVGSVVLITADSLSDTFNLSGWEVDTDADLGVRKVSLKAVNNSLVLSVSPSGTVIIVK